MSKKRTSDESCSSAAEEQTNNSAAADVPQEDDNTKRAKLTPFMSDTTLQDLPIELIECILIKVVVMEVQSMKLAKSVWTEKAELVINRLADVCWQWNSVLSTDVFRTRLERALEDHGTIRLEILQQRTIPYKLDEPVSTVTTLRDEVFLHYRRYPRKDDYIKVYDCNKMAKARHVIPIPGSNTESIVACTVSNCVYILKRKQRDHYSILRITGDSDPRWSTVSEVIADINLPGCGFCVAADGRLILSRKQTKLIPAISVYDANGSLQQTIRLSTDINGKISAIIPKPNGNLVLIGSRDIVPYEDDDDDNDYDDDDDDNSDDDNNDDDDDDDDDFDDDYDVQALLTEIDMNGTKISQHLISLGHLGCLDIHSSIVDGDGRMMALSRKNGMQLFDSDFNRMDFTGDQLIGPNPVMMFASVKFQYNSERKESIMLYEDFLMGQAHITAFRLEEQ